MKQLFNRSAKQHKRITFEEESSLVSDITYLGWARTLRAMETDLSAHTHDDAFEFCYLVKGHTRWWVEQEIYDLHGGDLYLTWPQENHGGIDNVLHPCELFWVQLRLTDAGAFLGFSDAESKAIVQELKGLRLRKCVGNKIIEDHFASLLNVAMSENPFREAQLRSQAQLLLLSLLDAFRFAKKTKTFPKQHSTSIANAIQFMKKHFHTNVTIEDIAEVSGLKLTQFRVRFKEETGMSPLSFLNQVRINYAKELLKNSSQSITDIAFACGFQTSQYFATVFKRIIGISPLVFRKRK
ncbi:MAG: AraC family transcriptional regulator [Lentisphaeria bacterium]|nr:AraC family transcriptional regulator [Lentisphaeria bacterium]